jgi:transcriptional antiterminator
MMNELSDKVVQRFVADLTKQLQGDMTKLLSDMTAIRGDMTAIRGNMTAIRGDMTKLLGDLTAIRDEVAGLIEGQARQEAMLREILERLPVSLK